MEECDSNLQYYSQSLNLAAFSNFNATREILRKHSGNNEVIEKLRKALLLTIKQPEQEVSTTEDRSEGGHAVILEVDAEQPAEPTPEVLSEAEKQIEKHEQQCPPTCILNGKLIEAVKIQPHEGEEKYLIKVIDRSKNKTMTHSREGNNPSVANFSALREYIYTPPQEGEDGEGKLKPLSGDSTHHLMGSIFPSGWGICKPNEVSPKKLKAESAVLDILGADPQSKEVNMTRIDIEKRVESIVGNCNVSDAEKLKNISKQIAFLRLHVVDTTLECDNKDLVKPEREAFETVANLIKEEVAKTTYPESLHYSPCLTTSPARKKWLSPLSTKKE